MSSIDALVSAIDAARERVEAVGRSIAASLSTAGELSGQFKRLGAGDKAGQAEQITQALEEQQARALAAVQQAEAARAQAEALRGSRGSGGGWPPPGPPPVPAAPPPEPKGWDSAPDLAASRGAMSKLGYVSPGREVHILDGDGTGRDGGHRWDSEIPGKTKFPRGWNDDKIIDTAADIAKNPDRPPSVQDNGRWRCSGEREGVSVRVILEADGSVWTAHPVSGPGVETNPR